MRIEIVTETNLEEFSRMGISVRPKEYQIGSLSEALCKSFFLQSVPFARKFWLVRGDNNQPLARIGASLSATVKDVGYLGFFESDLKLSQIEVNELIHTATSWLESQGAKNIYGPVNFNTWFPYRFRLDDGDSLQFSWEPVQPPEYVSLFEGAGFKAVETYHSFGHPIKPLIPALGSSEAKTLSRGHSFRRFDSKNLLQREVPILYKMSMASFQSNFLFEPITESAFTQLYVPIATKLDVSLSEFLLDPSGNEVGFCFCYIDGDFLVIKSLAVLPEARGVGASNAMVYRACKAGLELGIEKFVSAMVKAGAQSESYARHTSTLWRHDYAVYSFTKGLTGNKVYNFCAANLESDHGGKTNDLPPAEPVKGKPEAQTGG